MDILGICRRVELKGWCRKVPPLGSVASVENPGSCLIRKALIQFVYQSWNILQILKDHAWIFPEASLDPSVDFYCALKHGSLGSDLYIPIFPENKCPFFFFFKWRGRRERGRYKNLFFFSSFLSMMENVTNSGLNLSKLWTLFRKRDFLHRR